MVVEISFFDNFTVTSAKCRFAVDEEGIKEVHFNWFYKWACAFPKECYYNNLIFRSYSCNDLINEIKHHIWSYIRQFKSFFVIFAHVNNFWVFWFSKISIHFFMDHCKSLAHTKHINILKIKLNQSTICLWKFNQNYFFFEESTTFHLSIGLDLYKRWCSW